MSVSRPTCGSVVDGNEQPPANTRTVRVQDANAQQGGDHGVHRRPAFLQHVARVGVGHVTGESEGKGLPDVELTAKWRRFVQRHTIV